MSPGVQFRRRPAQDLDGTVVHVIYLKIRFLDLKMLWEACTFAITSVLRMVTFKMVSHFSSYMIGLSGFAAWQSLVD